jgi:antimicrobial peptide system SdpB family protein
MYKKYILRIANTTFTNNTIGIARSFLALATLVIIVFNDLESILSSSGYRFNFFTVLNLTSAKFLSILILLLVIIGWKPRITAIFHFWISFSIFDRMLYPEGGDRIAVIITFLLIPILFSDKRKSHWVNELKTSEESSFLKQCSNIFNHFAFTTVRVQICIIYFFSGISKPFLEETWIQGTAIYYYFSNPNFGYSSWQSGIVELLLNNPYLLLMMTWGAILFEISLAFCLVASKKYYKYFLIAGITLHFLIFLIQGLSTFFLVMTGALFIYLGPKEGYRFKKPLWNLPKLLKKNKAVKS